MIKTLKNNKSITIIIGIMLISLTHFRWSWMLFAYLIPVPFMIFLEKWPSKKSILLIFAAFIIGFSIATTKIITGPLPLFFALFYGVPLGIIHALPYLGWYLLMKKLPTKGREHFKIISFAIMATVIEWIQHRFSPLGSWGSFSYTQMSDLYFIQIVSLTGIAGISFIVYWGGALLAGIINNKHRILKLHTGIYILIFALVHLFGALRIQGSKNDDSTIVTIAAVGTDSIIGRSKTLPTLSQRKMVQNNLINNTILAVKKGAEIVVWNEAATMVFPKEELVFQKTIRKTAENYSIHLVAAYVVVLSKSPLKYENKYIWVLPSGEIDHSYLKHEPVPGEPAIKGVAPHVSVNTRWGKMGGAICYDFDFPHLAGKLSKSGISLAVLPSSDWRGIDPTHTKMASLRAIEGGYSLLRSTRFGLSAGYDAYGRSKGELSAFKTSDKILIVKLPVISISTIYRRFGDWFVYLNMIILLMIVIFSIYSTRMKKS